MARIHLFWVEDPLKQPYRLWEDVSKFNTIVRGRLVIGQSYIGISYADINYVGFSYIDINYARFSYEGINYLGFAYARFSYANFKRN